MGKVYVIQTGQTALEAQSRIDAVAGSPLTDGGIQAVRHCAAQLRELGVSDVIAGSGEAERHSAKLAAKELGAKVRTEQGLRELDFGLWQGLTVEEIRKRQPKLYRDWLESPTSVRPPGGETLEEARGRLRAALKQILKRYRNSVPLLVLPPVMRGLMECVARDLQTDAIWQNVETEFAWADYEINGNGL